MEEKEILEKDQLSEEQDSGVRIKEKISQQKIFAIIGAFLVIVVILGLVFMYVSNQTGLTPKITDEIDPTTTATPLIIDEKLDTEGASPVMQYELDQPKITISPTDSNLVYLTGPDGRALYTPVEECSGECMNDWQPYLVLNPIPNGADYNSLYISTINLSENGTRQYTWGNIPLYYYKNDVALEGEELAEIKGAEVDERWTLVKP